MFRFTLGNDDLDALVPRIVGVAGATLLALNHLFGGEPSEAQARQRRLCGLRVACSRRCLPEHPSQQFQGQFTSF